MPPPISKKALPAPPPGRLQEGLAFAMVLALAAFLRFWRLEQNGFGNGYYAAAVRSMLGGWHAFFFASFDPAGYVSVDKPPLALWMQAASAKALGFSSFSLLLPQALEGLASVALLYALVRRRFDAWAAGLAALGLALMPVSVAVDRFNNVDSCLILVLLMAAWALSRAVERGSKATLFLALGLIGLGFNTKMLAAWVLLPVFYASYFLGAPLAWRRRLGDLALASAVLVMVSLSWPLAVDLTPASQRPYVGSTQDNSMVGLALGWNGFQRLLTRGRGFQNRAPVQAPGLRRGEAGIRPERRAGQRGFMGSGNPGPLRLADLGLGGQALWLLPLALLGLYAAAKQARKSWPLLPAQQSLVLWAGWLLIYGLVLSFMQGAMHAYYTVLLAPALAALFGIGLRALWLEFEEGQEKSLLPLGLLLTAVWQLYLLDQAPDWEPLLLPLCLGGTALGLLALNPYAPAFQKRLGLGISLAALLACPALWSMSSVLAKSGDPQADPSRLLGASQRGFAGPGGDSGAQDARLLAFLQAQRHGERYLVVAPNIRPIAPLIIKSGEAAMALGGFSGSDPILTLDDFTEMAKEKQFRFVLLQGEGRGQRGPMRGPGMQGAWGQGGQNGAMADISKWVRAHGKVVAEKLWRGKQDPHAAQAGLSGPAGNFARRQGGAGMQLYEITR